MYKKGNKYMNKKNQKKVVCRPCKEENNWEIMEPNGQVQSKHYQTKSECVRKARQVAEEFGCELVVENKENNN